jgi:transcriptional regulator with XRE-family HTH domain
VAARIPAQQGEETTMIATEDTKSKFNSKVSRRKTGAEHDAIMVTVGYRIRTLRKAQGLSLRRFGPMAGVHHFHVMAIEQGRMSARAPTLAAIAKGLGVSASDLLSLGANGNDIEQIVELCRITPALLPRARAFCENAKAPKNGGLA